MDNKEIIQRVVSAGIIGILAATIRALMAKNETTMQRVRNFIAGVCMALVLGFILREITLSNFWKEIIIGCAAAFISTIWPVLENFVTRFTKKKANDIIKDSDNN
jgi:ABC-type siderophore export system fused ATPase/permease subunit